MEQLSKTIAPQYLALVERFRAQPIRSVKRVKMLFDFTSWYKEHKDELTDDEKEYLQSNIRKMPDDN